MNAKNLCIFSLLGLLNSWLQSSPAIAQLPTDTSGNNPATYEDDRLRVVVSSCNRTLQSISCQASVTSKSNDRIVEINGNNIRLVDFDGNEYMASSVRLANRNSVNNSIRTELVENVPFSANLIFAKIPPSVAKIALLQIQFGGSVTTNARFRNIGVDEANIVKIAVPTSKPTPKNQQTIATEAERNVVCPEPTKVLYRATSEHYLLYICGVKNPTHYVALAKDGAQGMTLRLRYYDREQFSADNGTTNYTIANDRLIIRKDNKIIYREKIQVIQPLAGNIIIKAPVPKVESPKVKTPSSSNRNQKRSTSEPTTNLKNKSKVPTSKQ